MLWARASAWAVKDYLPDVSLGLVTTDEAAEIAGEIVAETEEPEPPAEPPEADETAADEAWEASRGSAQ